MKKKNHRSLCCHKHSASFLLKIPHQNNVISLWGWCAHALQTQLELHDAGQSFFLEGAHLFFSPLSNHPHPPHSNCPTTTISGRFLCLLIYPIIEVRKHQFNSLPNAYKLFKSVSCSFPAVSKHERFALYVAHPQLKMVPFICPFDLILFPLFFRTLPHTLTSYINLSYLQFPSLFWLFIISTVIYWYFLLSPS